MRRIVHFRAGFDVVSGVYVPDGNAQARSLLDVSERRGHEVNVRPWRTDGTRREVCELESAIGCLESCGIVVR